MFCREATYFWQRLNLSQKGLEGRFQTAWAGEELCVCDFSANEDQTHFSLGKMTWQGKGRCENQTPVTAGGRGDTDAKDSMYHTHLKSG